MRSSCGRFLWQLIEPDPMMDGGEAPECHSEQLADLVLRLDKIGYQGDYSYEVFNDDYQQLPLNVVAQRARRSTLWLSENVLHRSPPLHEWVRQTRSG